MVLVRSGAAKYGVPHNRVEAQTGTCCNRGKIPQHIAEFLDNGSSVSDIRCSISLLLLDLTEQTSGLAKQPQQREAQRPAIAALVGH